MIIECPVCHKQHLRPAEGFPECKILAQLLRVNDENMQLKKFQAWVSAKSACGRLKTKVNEYEQVYGDPRAFVIDYGKVVPLVDFTARVMTALLDPDGSDD